MSTSTGEVLLPGVRLRGVQARQLLTVLDRVAPWLVVALAAALRFALLDQAAFTFDDADALRRARAIAAGFPALTGGMTSWGISDPPLLVYLLALPARLPSPILSSYALMALLSTLVVAGTYLVTARFFGRRLALVAALLCAVNPWVVYFGRRVWVEVQPALTLLALWAALEVVVEGRSRFSAPFFLALSAGVQARLLAVSYAPAALVALALGGRRWLSSWSLLGIAAGGLLGVPYLLHVLDTRDQIAAALADGQRGLAAAPRLAALQLVWWFTAGVNLVPAGARLADWLDLLALLLGATSLTVAALLAAGLVGCVAICLRRPSVRSRYLLLLTWLILPFGVITWQRSAVYLHYFMILVPAVFIVLALPLNALLGAGRAGGGLALAALLLIIATHLVTWGVLQRTLALYTVDEQFEAPVGERRLLAALQRRASVALGTGEQYGIETPLRFWLAGAERVRQVVPRGADLLVLADGASPEAADLAARLDAVLGPDLTARFVTSGALVLPLERAAYLLVGPDIEPPFSVDRVGSPRAVIPLPTLARGARDGLRLSELPARDVAGWAGVLGAQMLRGAAADDGPQAFLAPVRARPGEVLSVLTLWSGPAADLRPALVLVGAEGRPVQERPTTLPAAVTLAGGELLVRRHQLVLPNQTRPGTYQLMALDGRPATPPAPLATLTVVPT